jgi:hypothetical protein
VPGLGGTVWVYSARKVIVGEDYRRADEGTILNVRRFVDECVVLDLDVVADHDTRSDVGPPPHNAVLAENGPLAHLGEMPYR